MVCGTQKMLVRNVNDILIMTRHVVWMILRALQVIIFPLAVEFFVGIKKKK